MSGRTKQLAALAGEAATLWRERNAPRLAAALAYYSLFSVAPLLIVITAILGLVFGEEAGRGEIAPRLTGLLGPRAASAVQLMLMRAGTPGSSAMAMAVGVVSVFFGASLAVNELRDALNTLWGTTTAAPTHGGALRIIAQLLRERLVAFVAVLVGGVLMVLSVLASSAVAFAGAFLEAWLPAPEFVLQAVHFLAAWALMAGTFALIFMWLPDAAVSGRDAAVGAVVTALLFGVGNLLISEFLGRTASMAYAPAGSLLALLMWLYYSTLAFLLGAAFTAVFARRYGSGISSRRRERLRRA